MKKTRKKIVKTINPVFSKLKKAREIMDLTQTETAIAAGITQRDVSSLEIGKRKFVPNEYLQYMLNNGVDLNWLFDTRRSSDENFVSDDEKFRSMEERYKLELELMKGQEKILLERIKILEEEKKEIQDKFSLQTLALDSLKTAAEVLKENLEDYKMVVEKKGIDFKAEKRNLG